MSLVIFCNDPEKLDYAEQLAQQAQLPFVTEVSPQQTHIAIGSDEVALCYWQGKKCHSFAVDFVKGHAGYRRRHGGGRSQMLARACGLKRLSSPRILDANAGFGQDAFVLASLGCKVTMLERSPLVAALLSDGLQRLHQQAWSDTIELQLLQQDALAYLTSSTQQYDVVYLDPMYPSRQKSGAVKIQMRLLRTLVGDDTDADNLLPLALQVARYRVVVKRPKSAPALPGSDVDITYSGASTRYDVYQSMSSRK